MPAPTPPTAPLRDPALKNPRGVSRRTRYILASLILAILLVWLAIPMLSSKIVPPSAVSETMDVYLVVKEGNTWLALPRPDGSIVAFAFAPQSPPASYWETFTAWAGSRPGSLLKHEISTTASFSTATLATQDQETWVIHVPQRKAFDLIANLDNLYAQNIATLNTFPSSAVRQVAISDNYSPLFFNANQWAAMRLRDLDVRVEGVGLLNRWSIEPATP